MKQQEVTALLYANSLWNAFGCASEVMNWCTYPLLVHADYIPAANKN
jgi:hypothetical protein